MWGKAAGMQGEDPANVFPGAERQRALGGLDGATDARRPLGREDDKDAAAAL